MGNKFRTTEDLMEHLKNQIIQHSNGKEIILESAPDTWDVSSNETMDLTRFKQEVERNNLLWNVSAEQPITSHRKGTGKIIVFGKKLIRKFLRWYVANPFQSQAEFNGSVARSFNETSNLLVVAKGKLEEISVVQKELMDKVNSLEEKLVQKELIIKKYEKEFEEKLSNIKIDIDKTEISVLNRLDQSSALINDQNNALNNLIFSKLDELNGRIHYSEQQFRSELNFQNYRIRRIQKLYSKDTTPMPMELNLNEDKPTALTDAPDFDYLLFENRFRGTNEDIRNRQLKYLPYFENKQNVLDIGCGRGEFLELLLSKDISAKGIDVTQEMVEYCQDLGLPVQNQDALVYLQQQQDNSIGGIFLGQVIEHIPFENIIQLVDLAWKKLMPGSFLIMETPNPQTLAIFNRSFYMDPTHVKPVHPLTVQFLVESVGFREAKIVFSGRVEKEMAIPHIQSSKEHILNIDEFNNSIDRVNDLLFGDQDYAIIARK
ncbi:class I SAM-dependent methyltransferase ['Paenibacillus yunnanensis' Narsing Rao et al. 2020]|uniref:class I SAM-dependent methyltransferase n=1 Tax=Paenibacillus tengchongensis TaxID=2608684 RepID=UPI00124E6B6D|nr:class I SAM-dependent methyltransferase [Paenibacillus tengchongensis]